jgi:NHL repeat
LQAAMAQPSGITTDGKRLYVADSETSAIRAVTLGLDGTVSTLVGEGLFEFGDRDGTGKASVRLQHPLGVTYHDGVLYIADTYNHKIKRLFPAMETVTTYCGSGKPGRADGNAAEFYEPGGLSIAAGKLYVADTNNHAIRVADLATGEVTTMRLQGLPLPSATAGFSDTSFGIGEAIQEAPQEVKAGAAGSLLIELTFAVGYHLNPLAPLSYEVRVAGTGIDIAEQDRQYHAVAPHIPLAIPFQAAAGRHQATVDIEMTFYYCREANTGVCAIQSVRWLVPLYTSPDSTVTEPFVSYNAQTPVLQRQL